MPIWSKQEPQEQNNQPNATQSAEASNVEDWVLRFTVGDDYVWDRMLLPYDVRATRAHVWGLAEIGIVTEAEQEAIGTALEKLLQAFESGAVTVEPQDEDCHTVIERFLTEQLGDVGRSVHAGRSRNDQVLAALRLLLQDKLSQIGKQVSGVVSALVRLAETHDGMLLPGYTHMQRAMPSTVPLWALGYAETLISDLNDLRHVRSKVNVSPLGSAAGYGVPHLNLPREAVAKRLGFDGVQTHVTSVQMMRGKHELAVAHACAQTVATANRMASDLVLFTTREFGFVDLPDAYCTGSSIMPQKKNPDVLELIRGSYHRVVGEMQSLATLSANLTSGYHRDVQLTKGAVLRVLQTTEDVLSALNAVLQGLSFRRETTEAACTTELLATASALEQVVEGVPFRTAYRAAASGEQSRSASTSVGKEAGSREAGSRKAVLDSYQMPGTPGNERPAEVMRQLDAVRWWDG